MAALVFLHGPAAAGKLTVSRAVEALVGYPVFHNHLVVDLLTTVFPFGSDAFVELRERFWFDVIDASLRDGESLLFTFAPESTVPIGFPERLADVVAATGGRLCSVSLLVGEVEQEQRIADPSRHEFHKLTDADLLRRGRRTERREIPPADLVVDTETVTAAEAAAVIVAHFRLAPQLQHPRYPDDQRET